ncbi:MAG: glycosyltransferase family 4 protein [Deltaproteobacteria bacterium]|nr:glycosyltransferase family 4 protein [Deltaproteobacteria bacterium]
MTRIRILIFTQQLSTFRSGVGTYAHGLTSELASRGHELTVVVPEDQMMEMAGVRVIGVHPCRFDPTPGGWFTLGRSFAAVLRREISAHDIVYFTDAREAWATGKKVTPVVGMAHDSYALDWLRPDYPRGIFADYFSRSLYYLLLRLVERYTYPRLDALVTNSYHVGQAIANSYRIRSDMVSVIRLGLPVRPHVETITLKGQPSILFVGGNFQRKGLHTLLTAISMLRKRFPKIRLHVVGRDKNQVILEKTVARLGIIQRVVFHGKLDNDLVRGMMKGVHMFVLPSFTEGFGLVYLEAMRAGTPVIATTIGGAGEVFKPGVEALFAAPNDAKGLAFRIEKLAGDPEISARLGRNGMAAAARLTTDKMTLATEDLFSRLLGRCKKKV